jgi:cytochrome P450
MIDMVMTSTGQEGGAPTDVELQDFCVNMIFAGHDTTLATAQGILHYLKAVPDIESKLRSEVDMVWDGKTPINRAQLQQLTLCRAFVMEVLRIVPPVAQVVRTAKKDIAIDGYHVPAGMALTIPAFAVSEEYFGAQDAVDFKLERHLDKSGSFLDRMYETASFPSFGGGSRMCIGYKFAMDELLIFMMVLLRGFAFEAETMDQVLFPIRSWQVRAKFNPRGEGELCSSKLAGA